MGTSTQTWEWEGSGQYATRAVGTSHYRSDLAAIAQNDGKRALVLCTGLLVREQDNRHDPNAISVKVLGQTVGYLSREFAGRYRQAVLTELGDMPAITVRAAITGGHQDKGKLYEYSVELDLAEPLRLKPKTASDPEIVRHNGFGQLSPAGVDARASPGLDSSRGSK